MKWAAVGNSKFPYPFYFFDPLPIRPVFYVLSFDREGRAPSRPLRTEIRQTAG